MKKFKYLAIIVLLISVFVFPIGANADLVALRLYYYPPESDAPLQYISIIVPKNLKIENRAKVIFSLVFDDFEPSRMNYTPANVEILSIGYLAAYSHLVIDVSPQIRDFGGGHFEYRLVARLLQNARGLGVRQFTMLIDGEVLHLPEGSLLFYVDLCETTY